jgi:hypothetical protein
MLIFKNKLQLFVISSLTFILMDIGICPWFTFKAIFNCKL